MYYHPQKKILISKSFKTASSSFFSFLKDNCCGEKGLVVNKHITLKNLLKKYKLNSQDVTKIVQVRNPWGYIVSAYYWAKSNKECPSNYTFEDFVFKSNQFYILKQLEFWDLNYIDKVIRFEHLKEDIKQFCLDYNFSYINISHQKKGSYKKHYREVHTQETAQYVANIFHK